MIYRPAKNIAKELRKGRLYRQSAVVHVSSAKHKEAYDRMRADPSHSKESDEEIHQRAAYYLVWQKHGRPKARLRKRVLFGVVLLALILLVLAGTGHCQLSGIKLQESGVAKGSVAGGFATLNFAGCTVSAKTNNAWTITCAGGPGGPSTDAGTANNFFSSYNSGTGLFGKTRPTCSTLSDSGTLCTSSATIPAAQVNADWTASGTIAEILHKPTLGTAAAKNIPASGDAAATEVVYGSDTRLTNTRTPTAHATQHVTGGTDVIAAAVAAGNSGLMTGTDKTKLDGIAAGATVGVAPAGSAKQLQYQVDATHFGGIAGDDLGKLLIGQGAGNAPVFADPQTQGTQAAASTTIPNPLVLGGSDYAGTPAVRVNKVDSAGSAHITVDGTVSMTLPPLELLNTTDFTDVTAAAVVTGDILTGQSSKWARLAGNNSATPSFYTSTGTGAAANAPTLTTSTGSGSVVLGTSPTMTGVTQTTTTLTPVTAGGSDIGSALLPYANLWIGGAATNNIKLAGTAVSAKVATLPDNTGTIAELNFAQTWSAAQSYNSGTFLPAAAGGTDVGATATPFGNLWVGTAATNNFKFQPATTSGARIITIADPLSPTTVALPLTIGSGTTTLTSATVTTATCQTANTTAATGVLSTDVIVWTYNAAPSGTTDARMTLAPYVTAGNVNFVRCNPTASSIVATAIVVNWKVIR